MKRYRFGLAIILLFCLGLAFLVWFKSRLSPVSSSAGTLLIVVAPSQSAAATFSDLAAKNLIKSALVARIYARIQGVDQKILPGDYFISPDMSLSEILRLLSSGPQDIRITFPEGWRREQIAARLTAALSPANFSASDFLTRTATLEGQLFPDTYLFPPSATSADVVTIISRNYAQKVGVLDRSSLILASLVEREAREVADRPIIAGILKKRLEAGWPLQVDATVQYGRDSAACSSHFTGCDWWSPLSDTRFSTIYNTYLHPGLPPGPICNPGLASITAVRHPADTPYWYYLTGHDGVTRYARDLGEHNRNIDKYLTP